MDRDDDGDAAGEQSFGTCLRSLVDEGNIESSRYYLARRTALEMLKDRGYAVPNREIDLSLEEFRNKHGQMPDVDSLTIDTRLMDDPEIKLQVRFLGPSIIKVNSIRAITAELLSLKLERAIFIVQSKITSQALKSIDVLPFKVEIFEIKDLLVNVTKHELKPKHQILSNKEKEDLLKKYSINEKQLPRMSEKDAMSRYYGYKKGQVVKITYNSELTQMHVAYRCVW
ncbi:DNA-directed RNA polymerase V subunit 5A-like [Andrographis paniculata]|uniref:DNA-directed RNA polymerase V subunit 5A-like n=1 Tax=Andrographis paniculata TaxID=175694 RepID=UPI0021E8DFAE|nr:DNA-directed RNA polymerase V subunit 5A-like [Andrographis paniculata]